MPLCISWEDHLLELRAFLAKSPRTRRGIPKFEEKRYDFTRSRQVSDIFELGRIRGLFVTNAMRHVVIESVVDVLHRSIERLSNEVGDTTMYSLSSDCVSAAVAPVEDLELSHSDRHANHNSFFGWACWSLLRLLNGRASRVSETQVNSKKWKEQADVLRKMRTLGSNVNKSGSLVTHLDRRTELLNKGGLYLPPTALEAFTSRARLLISTRVTIARFHKNTLRDAEAVVDKDAELKTLWDEWYSTFEGNPDVTLVHSESIRQALLSKLINSAFGVILKEINARYTNIAKNKKMKLTLREELKVISNNTMRGSGCSSSIHSGFQALLQTDSDNNRGNGGGGRGGESGLEVSGSGLGGGDVSGENEPEEENIDYDALFLEFETDTFGLEVGHDFDGDDEEVTDVIVDDDSIGLLDYTNDPQHAGIAGWLESMSSI